MERIKNLFVKTDYILLILAIVLTVFGIVAIYSAGYNPIAKATNTFYLRQIAWLVAGIFFFFLTSLIDYRSLTEKALVFYIIGVASLLLVLLVGFVFMGARRWIGIGSFMLQPSEIFKVSLTLMAAWVFAKLGQEKMGLLSLAKNSWPLIAPFALIALQPDLGTGMTYVLMWLSVMVFLGIKYKVYLIALLVAMIIIPIAWFQMHDYQQNRIKIFLGIVKDDLGLGWQAEQSKIAVGSGGIKGKGILKGTQAHLNFLPASHTDFIFSVINEELGLIGGVSIIALFLFLVIRVGLIASQALDAPAKIICMSLIGFIFVQFAINAGMTIGLSPIVGIPMPFVSYGGTSLITFFILLGLVNSVQINRFNPRAL